MIANGVSLPAGDARIPAGTALQLYAQRQPHSTCPNVLWTCLPNGKLWVVDGPDPDRLASVARDELGDMGFTIAPEVLQA